MNFDGGFGCRPGSESHAGQIYCCTGFLAITSQLHQVNSDLLGWWLCERQLPSGGLNGRPEKLPDVCYSWWVLASLKIIGRLHWIDREKLRSFILACQDEETGICRQARRYGGSFSYIIWNCWIVPSGRRTDKTC